MKRKIAYLLIFVLLVCMSFACSCGENGEEIVKNGNLEEIASSGGLPVDWEFYSYYSDHDTDLPKPVSYYTMETDPTYGNVVKLTNSGGDDSRLLQAITVKPNKTYKFTCYVKTSDVVGTLGANIGFEDSTAHSNGITGTQDWTKLEVIGKTGKDQKTVQVGLRLGGFGAEATGTAWFSGLTVEQVSSSDDAVLLYTESTRSGSSSSNTSTNTKEAAARSKMVVIMCFVYILVPIAIAFLLHYESKYDKHRRKPYPKTLAQSDTPFFSTKPDLPGKTDTKLHYTRKDWIFVTVLTVVYAAVALTNLGSLKGPENAWKGDVNSSIVISLDEATAIYRVSQNGGIASASTYTLTSDTGKTISFGQEYGSMYRWSRLSGSKTNGSDSSDLSKYPFGTEEVKTVTLLVTKGNVVLNELAFFDANGDTIPVHAETEEGSALFDEQGTASQYRTAMTGMYFDELYHARTAYEGLNGMSIYEWTHPPLGKQIIGIGISIFGMNPFGWRCMGAVFGIAMIPVMYAFGKRLFKRSELALLAAGLLAFDFMHFAQTRIATIDTYGVFFNLCMIYYMYKFIKMDLGDDLKSTLVPLGLSGLFFGLGCSSKWICVYTGAALAVMFFAKMIVMWVKSKNIRKQKNLNKASLEEPAYKNAMNYPKRFLFTCLWCVLFFIVVPVAIYIASYRPYWNGEWKQQAVEAKTVELRNNNEIEAYEYATEDDLTFGDKLSTYINGVIKNQKDMYNYHSKLTATHAYQSAWYEWPLSNRPVWFCSSEDADNTRAGTISTFGNPAVWWLCFVGTLIFVIMLLLGKIRLNSDAFMILMSMASAMLPWMLVSRCVFVYHYFATVPFIILASVYVLKHYEDKYCYFEVNAEMLNSKNPGAPAPKTWVKYIKWVWLILAVALFCLFYPVISGVHVSKSYIRFLQWLPTWTFLGIWH